MAVTMRKGRDPLAAVREAAWSLIQWRDHPKPWARPEGFDRMAGLDAIIQTAGIIADMLPNKPRDEIVRGLMPVAEFAARGARGADGWREG